MISWSQMRELESGARRAGISEAQLIEAAGLGLARELRLLWGERVHLRVYLGSGHNAADALVATQHLRRIGMSWEAHWAVDPAQAKPEVQKHWDRLLKMDGVGTAGGALTRREVICIDGLLGIGSTRPLSGRFAQLAEEMNALRALGARTLAVDLPSGLGEQAVGSADSLVRADATVCLGGLKGCLLQEWAEAHVGRLSVVALPGMPHPGGDLLGHDSLRGLLPARPWNCHKRSVGKVALVAGSPVMLGAAELACAAALRSGVGMVTLFCDPEALAGLASRLPSEVLLRPWDGSQLPAEFDAVAVGPGLGTRHQSAVLSLLRSDRRPMVVDADAIRAPGLDWRRLLAQAQGCRVLTPHAGELARLAWPQLAAAQGRVAAARCWAEACPEHVLVLKGARTLVADGTQGIRYNGTGHAGMACAGMGDALTGCLVGLMAQGLAPAEAASLAVWATGRAAELAALDVGWRAVLPSDVIARLGLALSELGQVHASEFGLP